MAEGGQGLINIRARIASSRLQTAQRLLYTSGPGWLDTARLLLRRAGRLGYDKQLFLLQPEDVALAGLTPFYSSVLQAWQILRPARTADETPGTWLSEEPEKGLRLGLGLGLTSCCPSLPLTWTSSRLPGERQSTRCG